MLIQKDEIGNSYIRNCLLEKDIYIYLKESYEKLEVIDIKINQNNEVKISLITSGFLNVFYIEKLQEDILRYLNKKYGISLYKINIRIFSV